LPAVILSYSGRRKVVWCCFEVGTFVLRYRLYVFRKQFEGCKCFPWFIYSIR